MSFGSLGLCDELLKTVAEQGYRTPTAIQTESIPAVLSRHDVMAVAGTGSGKTAGFALPMVQLLSGGPKPTALHARALVITPTRELAAQVALSVQIYSRELDVCSAAVFGGVRIEPQIAQLQSGLHVLVATPGRLIDLYEQGAIHFDQLEILVLDEADRMLDLGFVDDIRRVQALLPAKRQSLMFSATFSDEIKSLAKGMLNNPTMIDVTTAHSAVESIKQKIYRVDNQRKSELLIDLIKRNKWPQVLVFVRTKRGADELVKQLQSTAISAASIHANRTQHARTAALAAFRNRDVVALVATDIAARGIDVEQLPCVLNFDLPYVAEDYVHRIGRTARAGRSGLAVSFYSEDEAKQLGAIERFIGRQFELETIPGYTPSKKPPAHAADDEEYGNFEPDARSGSGGRSQGRAGRGGGSSNRDRNKWKNLGGKQRW